MAATTFAIPLAGATLVYAPLVRVAALVDRAAVPPLRTGSPAGSPLEQLHTMLGARPDVLPGRTTGPFVPTLLGLITTRACNLACGYCGFWQAGAAQRRMPRALARAAIGWYLDALARAGQDIAPIHFFGGEPFSAADTVEDAVAHAEEEGARRAIQPHFEVTTNGAFDERRGRWVARHFHTVVLSLDGPAEIQNRNRPARGGLASAPAVERSAALLSEGPAELCIRTCVTSETVGRMAEIAGWLCRNFRPAAVCFETLQPTARSQAAGLLPPDPWEFARGFVAAAAVLASAGVEPVYTTADITQRRATFCPVGRDAMIVTPDGAITACYLLPEEWQAQGLDLTIGQIDAEGGVKLVRPAIERVRDHTVLGRQRCAGCFCRWHCAGGCHVNHRAADRPGGYDALCIQTRAIALAAILHDLGEEQLLATMLADQAALEAAVLQPSDAIDDYDQHHA